MLSPSVRIPLALGLWGVLATVAHSATLEERLVAQSDRLVPDQVVDRDANRLWTVRVTPSVDLDAVAATGATIDWAWPERGLMAVRGADPELPDLLATVPGVRAVEPTRRSDSVMAPQASVAGAIDPTLAWANGPDIYRENGQWPLYAIGAVEPVPAADTVSGWTPGEWALAQDGQGVTVGSVDTGGPTLWCDPVDVRVNLSVPTYGVCALFGGGEVDGECVVSDPELGDTSLGDVDALCGTLGELSGVIATLDGDDCRLDDVGLAEFYSAFTGYDYLNYEAVAAWFRPRQLHPDFDWYLSAADVAANPELGDPGGVVPMFGTIEDYEAFRDDRYLAHRVPTGLTVVEQELAFAEVTVALTDLFAEALEAGEVGACSTADARLPDPDALTWEPYSYSLFDAPFDPDGLYVRESWSGYDADGELRVILDPSITPVDMFGLPFEGHGTSTAGPIAGRYRPDGPYLGALRGVAPGTRFVSYDGNTEPFAFAAAWRRAPHDGVQVLNNSWVMFFDLHCRTCDPVAADDLDALALIAIAQAGDALKRDTLLVISAGNFATPLDDVREVYGGINYFDALPHALVVGGTAPRDYHWTGDIPAWLPDAPGQPYDALRRTQNMDRPMLAYVEFWDYFDGTAMGRQVDIVAPAGSWYVPDERCAEDDAWCILSAWDDNVWAPTIFDWVEEWNTGPHGQYMGTSFAAPYAVGVAALAAQAWEERHGAPPTPAQLKSILMITADGNVGPTWDEVAITDLTTETTALYWQRVDRPGWDEWMGAGRLDAPGAIARAGR